jgi:hypothetical protein
MRNYGIAGALLVALVLVQHFGLERTAEKKLEDKYSKVSELPASSVLPSYIASLFLGSFRAIVVDALWIEMRRMREEEHRYFETVEIMNFIAVLQPRNPEVWAQQAQDAGWNIANGIRDKTRKWEWIREAVKTLDKGRRQLPDNPYLKFEMARILFQKPTVRDGHYDWWYLDQVKNDAGMQALLRRTEKPERAKSAFELADDYLADAANDVRGLKERNGFRYYTSHTGYNLSLSTLEGYRRLCRFHEGNTQWRRGNRAAAAEAYRSAAAQAAIVFKEHGLGIYDDYGRIDAACAEVASKDDGTDPARVLGGLLGVLKGARRLDFEFVSTFAGELRKLLGGDGWEYNDSYEYSVDLPFRRGLEANLAGLADEDWYCVAVPGKPGEFGLETVKVQVQNGGAAPIVVEWITPQGGMKAETRQELKPGEAWELPATVDRHGNYFVRVAPAAPLAAGANSVYRLAWSDYSGLPKKP